MFMHAILVHTIGDTLYCGLVCMLMQWLLMTFTYVLIHQSCIVLLRYE